MAQIGLLILMGIVVNNGIVLVDHMNHFRRQGLSAEEAILRAGRDRLRPILMTAATTIIGLLPLAIGGVNVSGLLYFPMARTVMGGLMSSAVLTLLVLPYITLGTEGVALFMLPGFVPSAQACTNILVSKGASADGSVMISYSADSGGSLAHLFYLPAADHEEGEWVEVNTWERHPSPTKVKQVAHTFAVYN